MNHNLLLQLREITKLMSKITLTLHAKYLNMQDNKAPGITKFIPPKCQKYTNPKFFVIQYIICDYTEMEIVVG
jgi:hypothetical protein